MSTPSPHAPTNTGANSKLAELRTTAIPTEEGRLLGSVAYALRRVHRTDLDHERVTRVLKTIRQLKASFKAHGRDVDTLHSGVRTAMIRTLICRDIARSLPFDTSASRRLLARASSFNTSVVEYSTERDVPGMSAADRPSDITKDVAVKLVGCVVRVDLAADLDAALGSTRPNSLDYSRTNDAFSRTNIVRGVLAAQPQRAIDETVRLAACVIVDTDVTHAAREAHGDGVGAVMTIDEASGGAPAKRWAMRANGKSRLHSKAKAVRVVALAEHKTQHFVFPLPVSVWVALDDRERILSTLHLSDYPLIERHDYFNFAVGMGPMKSEMSEAFFEALAAPHDDADWWDRMVSLNASEAVTLLGIHVTSEIPSTVRSRPEVGYMLDCYTSTTPSRRRTAAPWKTLPLGELASEYPFGKGSIDGLNEEQEGALYTRLITAY